MKLLKFHLVFTLKMNDETSKGFKCDEKKKLPR